MSVNVTPPGGDEYTVASPPGRTRLVSPGDAQPVHTAVKETDSRTALTRGLAEYVFTISGEAYHGARLRFQKVFENWATPEEQAEYPSAIVYTTTPGTYDSSGFTSIPSKDQQIPEPDGRYVITPAEYVTTVTVEVWCTRDEERMAIVAMLEDAFNPFVGQGKYGFTLELPHYHNVRASFSPAQMGYMDDEASVIAGTRKALFTFEASVPVVRLVSFPDAKPFHKLAAIGLDVIVDGDC